MEKQTKKQKASIIINSIIFALTACATICMILGVNFMSRSEEVRAFTSANLEAFKYFTVDSNVLAGITALVYLCFEIALIKGRIQSLPVWLHKLRIAATSGVTLTMIITIFFLIPQFGAHWYILFMDNNLFFHLIIPILSIIGFVFLEPVVPVLKRIDSLFGIIPMATYAVFYTTNVLVHLENGMPQKDYDWYNFLNGSLKNAIIAIPAMLLVTWGIALLLCIGNKKVNSASSGSVTPQQ